MASVAHGGDAGGNPPGGNWDPPRGHISDDVKHGRGITTNKEMRDLWKANNCEPLEIDFDTRDQKSINPIGRYGQNLISLVGSIVKDNDFPKHYDSWARVPMSWKRMIVREVEKYFDMNSWYDGGKREREARAGLEWTCKERYKDAKYHFKKDNFILRGGYEDPNHLRDDPPHGVNLEKIWLPFVDRVTESKHISKAEANSVNRSKQKYHSKHGSRSYAMRRDKMRRDDPEKKYPSLIDDWQTMHTDKRDGKWNSDEAEDLHKKMVHLKAQSSGTSEEEILEEVLGTRSGHNRGRGRKLPSWITGSIMSLSSRGKGKGKEKVQEQNVMSMDDFTSYMQAMKAANPNLVIPGFPINNQDDDEEPEGSGNEEDYEDDEDDE